MAAGSIAIFLLCSMLVVSGAWTIEDGMPSTGIIVTGAENTSASEDKKS